MNLTDDESQYLADVQTVVDHVADPTNSDTLDDLDAIAPPTVLSDMYDDDASTDDADWDTWQADLDALNSEKS